ncbi:hypothetical protein SPRG_05168 [Saprolegnia parasitica CBS 223.65]|uniref:Protein odr-4 homolog n=1 Tax=Saprolegnia parasitica (strain CBS 223.65) TaxID=695850 RepID=A0A067CGU2_SAPPC|nr:hypothetical protein SPRG_05168 [Saprolegnia parasitica CBS 223.65]KDO29979.1 hypothetical protein SPRG_05168 [Saprolegnia parasitica CBS 223.65]|eukprot:XP_012199162.1 hypothetical protein SPRG_05168 [Saprolegnia parasitica CBS 223.65]
MTKVVVSEARVRDDLRSVRSFEVGLLLGHAASMDVIVIHVPTPPENAARAASRLADVSVDWMSAHAKSVLCMLPGGIDCLGLYVVTTEDPHALLPCYMCALQAIVGSTTDGLYMLCVSPTSSTMTSKRFQAPSSFVEARLQWQSVDGLLRRYEAAVRIDVRLPSLEPAALLAHVAPLLTHAIPVAGRDPGRVHFLERVSTNDLSAVAAATRPSTSPCRGLHLEGSVTCLAYALESAPLGDALRSDFERTMARRVALLESDMNDVSSCRRTWPGDHPRNVAVARRAQFRWPRSGFLTGNVHLFTDDDLSDSAHAIAELLTSPTPVGLQWVENEASLLVTNKQPSRTTPRVRAWHPSLFLALFAAVVATLVACCVN